MIERFRTNSPRVGARAPASSLWQSGCNSDLMAEQVLGDDRFVARAHVRNVAEMEVVIDKLAPYGGTNSSIVQSAPVPPRLGEL